MKVSLIQMDMKLGEPQENFRHAQELVREAAHSNPDVIVLPETWNVGFFPKENLAQLCDKECAEVKRVFSPLAKELNINIVAGSVANQKADGGIYNTACVFDRSGQCVAEYDKIHLFTPMGEHDHFRFGSRPVRFTLDGVSCGIIICYDVRFPELIRTLTVPGIEVLFIVAQWPEKRTEHWKTLTRARAIENQCFVASVNSCGTAGETKYAGCSALYDPWGEVVAAGGGSELILTGNMDLGIIQGIRSSINVYNDRKPGLYKGIAD